MLNEEKEICIPMEELSQTEDSALETIQTKIELLSIGGINIDSEFVDCNFTFEYTYNDYIEDPIDFMIENCIEVYSSSEICSKHYDGKIKKVWRYQAKIKIMNDTEHIPYNNVYLIINMILKNSYCEGANYTVVRSRESDAINYNYTSKLLKKTYIITPDEICSVAYIWIYNLSNVEHMIKYMLIPTLLTLLLQLTHRIKEESYGDFVGVAATLLLGDIALLFTIPETNTLIISEKIIYLNFMLKMALGTFAFYDWDVYFGEKYYSGIGHYRIDVIMTTITIIIILVYALYTLFHSLKRIKQTEHIIGHYAESNKIMVLDLDSFCEQNIEFTGKIEYTVREFLSFICGCLRNYCRCRFSCVNE